MILFFDTETSGFPKRNLPHNHPDQPSLVQLAALAYDTNGTERAAFNFIVEQSEEVPESAAKVHGITKAISQDSGLPLLTVLEPFDRLWRRAGLYVAHNLQFDMAIMEIAYARARVWKMLKPQANAMCCTMQITTPLMKLPHKNGGPGYKWPKLEEAHHHYFNERLEGAHDALVDVRATARLFFHLLAEDLLPQEVKTRVQWLSRPQPESPEVAAAL